MLHVRGGRNAINCAGASRRTVLKAGFLGLSGLSLSDLFRLEAAAAPKGSPGTRASDGRAVILIWLDGGPPQHETYDPKPEAPAEYRGAYGAVNTPVPGLRLSELLPLQAKLSDKMAFIRSVHHDNGDHFAAAHWMLTGRFGATGADQAQRDRKSVV